MLKGSGGITNIVSSSESINNRMEKNNDRNSILKRVTITDRGVALRSRNPPIHAPPAYYTEVNEYNNRGAMTFNGTSRVRD